MRRMRFFSTVLAGLENVLLLYRMYFQCRFTFVNLFELCVAA